MHGLRMPSTLAVQLWLACQAGFSSTSCSSSSLSSLTIPSSMLSSLSLWPSRYLGLGAALVVKRPPGRARPSPNSVSLASLSMAFAREEAKESRDLWTSAWTWTEDVLVFSAEEKNYLWVVSCEIYLSRCYSKQSPCLVWFILLLYFLPQATERASSHLLWSWEMTDTFGMLHLVFKGDRAPPLPRRISVLLQMGGAVDGEVIQEHYVCACRQREKNPSVKEVPQDTLKC